MSSASGTAVTIGFAALAIAADLGVGQLIPASTAIHAAQDSGLRHVQVTGTHRVFAGFHGCGESDVAEFDVTGVNPDGKMVRAHVCTGIFKGSTLRY